MRSEPHEIASGGMSWCAGVCERSDARGDAEKEEKD